LPYFIANFTVSLEIEILFLHFFTDLTQRPSTRLTTKHVRASEESVAQSFAESFCGSTSKKSKTAASEVSCSFEPFCKDDVVCWYRDKKEYFCDKHAQEGAEPLQKKSKK
jgi:hypothetical protein